MSEFRIRRRIDSETLHLPELRAMIGKYVEITVVEGPPPTPAPAAAAPAAAAAAPGSGSWVTKSVDELAAEQGVGPLGPLSSLAGGWPEGEADDGFEDAFRRWRDEGSAGRER